MARNDLLLIGGVLAGFYFLNRSSGSLPSPVADLVGPVSKPLFGAPSGEAGLLSPLVGLLDKLFSAFVLNNADPSTDEDIGVAPVTQGANLLPGQTLTQAQAETLGAATVASLDTGPVVSFAVPDLDEEEFQDDLAIAAAAVSSKASVEQSAFLVPDLDEEEFQDALRTPAVKDLAVLPTEFQAQSIGVLASPLPNPVPSLSDWKASDIAYTLLGTVQDFGKTGFTGYKYGQGGYYGGSFQSAGDQDRWHDLYRKLLSGVSFNYEEILAKAAVQPVAQVWSTGSDDDEDD